MLSFVRAAAPVVLLLSAGAASAADQQAIDAAIQKGVAYLKGQYKNAIPAGGDQEVAKFGVGRIAFTGITLLEAKTPVNDPVIQRIAATVRDAAFREVQTYTIALCLLFLDRMEDPADVPLIQMLSVRLLVGQNGQGGWGYECTEAVPQNEEQWLRTQLKGAELVGGNPPGPKGNGPDKPAAGKLLPDVEKYAAALVNKRNPNKALADDNSNTQFAVLGVWVARKYGVPADAALDLIERRFLATQDQQGSWPYMGAMPGSPSMACAGLLGLATGVARRDERRLKADQTKEEPTPKAAAPGADPFFTAPKIETPTPKKVEPKRQPDARDAAAQRAFAFLGRALVAYTQQPGGVVGGTTEQRGDRDLYTLWSIERVAVIYGKEKIGDLDWYEVGSAALLRAQNGEGAWSHINYGAEVNTSFAVLFLMRANLAKDMSKAKAGNNELRAGNPGAAVKPAPGPNTAGPAAPGTTAKPRPAPVEDESTRLAGRLVLTEDVDWTKALEAVRDGKGGDFTKGLVVAIHRLDGERKKQARNALAERLTRMSADTLQGMAKADDAELRRGAVLACAMKDDKVHVPDLIDRLTDDEELVVRAARAGLKSLTAQDFGPKPGATADECKAAAAAWRAWWAKQK